MMAKIEITSDAEFIFIEFNDTAKETQSTKIRKSAIRSVCHRSNDLGVRMVFNSNAEYILTHTDVDKVETNTTINSNTTLFEELKNLM